MYVIVDIENNEFVSGFDDYTGAIYTNKDTFLVFRKFKDVISELRYAGYSLYWLDIKYKIKEIEISGIFNEESEDKKMENEKYITIEGLNGNGEKICEYKVWEREMNERLRENAKLAEENFRIKVEQMIRMHNIEPVEGIEDITDMLEAGIRKIDRDIDCLSRPLQSVAKDTREKLFKAYIAVLDLAIQCNI